MQYLKIIITCLLISSVNTALPQKKRHLKKANAYFENGDYLFAQRYYEKYLSGTEDYAAAEKLLVCYKMQSREDKLEMAYLLLCSGPDQKYAMEQIMFLISQDKFSKAEQRIGFYLSNSSSEEKNLAEDLLKYIEARKSNPEKTCTANIEQSRCVELSASRNIDEHNPNLLFIWHFDDGVTKKGHTIQRCYQKAGAYSVDLSIEHPETGLIEESVKTEEFVLKPSPTFSTNGGTVSVMAVGETYTFKCNHPDSSEVYVWDFGDHTFASGPEVTHVYHEAKIESVKMYVLTKQNSMGACILQKVPVLYDFRIKSRLH